MTMNYEMTSRLEVMNFLNEISEQYPQAISFASGRPSDAFFDVVRWIQAIPRYQRHLAKLGGISSEMAGKALAQYGRTNGAINELIAAQLANDEGIRCEADHVVVTAGCQEAIALAVQCLCTKPSDVIIARNPTYIGITGVADLHGVEMVGLDCRSDDELADHLVATIGQLRANGKSARVLYLVPEFDNPTGGVICEAGRKRLLDICNAERIVILEDNPYGMFRYEGDPTPSMFEMDTAGCVIYLGTYSKTLCPTLRVGCAVVPNALFGDASASRQLLAMMGVRKSFFTLNTSQFNQAIIGGILLDQNCSLAEQVAPQVDYYRAKRDRLLDCLDSEFSGSDYGVSWNRPLGGFFLTMKLPFPFGRTELTQCANDAQVIPMPLSFFALDGSCQDSVRIAFSNISESSIEIGTRRLANYIRLKLNSIS